MALFHVSTSTPTKAETVASWVPTQPWCPPFDGELETVGSFHFDDPAGKVGMETHLVNAGGTLLQVPLTYRDAPLAGADEALAGTLEHSALGTRYLYDGLHDTCYLMMLAGVAMTGQGHALGMAEFEGRWFAAPEIVALAGGGWTGGPVAVDRFERTSDIDHTILFANDRFDLVFHRRPERGARPAIGLTASWKAAPQPVVVAEVRDRQAATT